MMTVVIDKRQKSRRVKTDSHVTASKENYRASGKAASHSVQIKTVLSQLLRAAQSLSLYTVSTFIFQHIKAFRSYSICFSIRNDGTYHKRIGKCKEHKDALQSGQCSAYPISRSDET